MGVFFPRYNGLHLELFDKWRKISQAVAGVHHRRISSVPGQQFVRWFLSRFRPICECPTPHRPPLLLHSWGEIKQKRKRQCICCLDVRTGCSQQVMLDFFPRCGVSLKQQTFGSPWVFFLHYRHPQNLAPKSWMRTAAPVSRRGIPFR